MSSGYESALIAFLSVLEGRPEPLSELAPALRFPVGSGLVGSSVGAELWASPEGESLIAAILNDSAIGAHFTDRKHAAELKCRISSFVERWASVPEASATDVVTSWSAALLEDLRIQQPSIRRFAALFGAEVREYVDLGNGVAIRPATPSEIADLVRQSGGTSSQSLSQPDEPCLIAISGLSGDRMTFGPYAATHAYAMGFAYIENVRYDIWTATGVFPRRGDQWVVEESRFPVNSFDRYIAPFHEVHSGHPHVATSVNGSTLQDVSRRTKWIRLDSPRDSADSLHLFERYLHLALMSVDPILVLPMSYAAVDGYLRTRNEPDNVVVRRLAVLLSDDIAERRALRSIFEAWYKLRSQCAHGEATDQIAINQFLRGSDQSALNHWGGEDHALIQRALTIGRKAYLVLLWSTLHITDDQITIAASRDKVLAELDGDIDNTATSYLASNVPEFVRAITI